LPTVPFDVHSSPPLWQGISLPQKFLAGSKSSLAELGLKSRVKKAIKERAAHMTSSCDEAKKMKLLTLHTHGCLRLV